MTKSKDTPWTADRTHQSEYPITLNPNYLPDSEKCSTPAAEDGHHFNIPLFPYSWTAYSGSELRHLVQGSYHHHLQGHREPHSPVSVYGAEDSGTESLYAQRGPVAGSYQDYSSTARQICRMRDGDELYLDVKQKPRGAEIKSESDLSCSNLESSGSYKCIKCCKVRLLMFTDASPKPQESFCLNIVLILFEFAEMVHMILAMLYWWSGNNFMLIIFLCSSSGLF